jgi:hypothetical protein
LGQNSTLFGNTHTSFLREEIIKTEDEDLVNAQEQIFTLEKERTDLLA